MFIGRKQELNSLEERYASDRFEFVVIYGRRRVGKTTLIRKFAQDKDCIFYMAVEGTGRENLAGLSQAVLNRGDLLNTEASFASFSALLDYIDRLCKEERLLLVIDEYPYLAASYPAISSLIQKHIDMCWKDSRMFLILCGSSMSFMERQVLGYKSPLYGRRTMQCRLKPFTFFEAAGMLSSWNKEEAALLYGITGGIPDYLRRLDVSCSAKENIRRMFFRESGHLYEEPVNLLKQELHEPASYHSILAAIAFGACKINEIAQKTGMETSGCSNKLTSLITLGIVRREVPVTEKESGRRTQYRLEDGMYQFWYRFVRPNQGSISMGLGDVVFDRLVEPQLPDYMGHVFEDICRQYLCRPEVCMSFPFLYTKVGRWWGNNPYEKRQEEIDLAAVGENAVLLGECKWRNENVSLKTVQTLLRRGRLFQYEKKVYCIFSKSGFDTAAAELAQENGVYMISFADMI